jgi:DNA-binding FadR family transcriptional regulator
MLNKQIRRHTIVEKVMEKMRFLISSGEFKIGDKIPNEKILAERFGIGRSSIREAIKILQYVGVIKSSTGKGTYLLDWRSISSEALTWTALLSKNDYFELIDVRFAIEDRCIKFLTQQYKQEKTGIELIIKKLEETVEKMRIAAERKDYEALIKTDYEFHNLIIKSHENDVFSSIYEILRSFLIDATREMVDHYKDPIEIFYEHEAILEKIKKGAIEEVSELYRIHIENSKMIIDKIH